MAYMFPHYIANQGQPSPALEYLWDSTRSSKNFQYDPAWLIDKIKNITTRAKIAL